jgi:hypothetical protein
MCCRDWGSFHNQLSAPSYRSADPALVLQQHALALAAEEEEAGGFPSLLSASTPTPTPTGGGRSGAQSGGVQPPQYHSLHPSRGGEAGEDHLFSIDPSSQRHLQASTETLASR